MESFERFRKILLENFNSELNEYKIKLENVEDAILKNNIEKQETKKKVLELEKGNDGSHDIFSPTEQNQSFNSIEIQNLTEKIMKIEEDIDTYLKTKETLTDKIKAKENIINIVDKFELSKEEVNSTNVINTYIDKLKFCSKICISDSNRCKIELDNIIKSILNDMNVSRETSEN